RRQRTSGHAIPPSTGVRSLITCTASGERGQTRRGRLLESSVAWQRMSRQLVHWPHAFRSFSRALLTTRDRDGAAALARSAQPMTSPWIHSRIAICSASAAGLQPRAHLQLDRNAVGGYDALQRTGAVGSGEAIVTSPLRLLGWSMFGSDAPPDGT